MACMARLVIPGIPHHVTQRGAGRAATFFGDGDHSLYRDLLAGHCAAAGEDDAMSARLRRAEQIGRPVGVQRGVGAPNEPALAPRRGGELVHCHPEPSGPVGLVGAHRSYCG